MLRNSCFINKNKIILRYSTSFYFKFKSKLSCTSILSKNKPQAKIFYDRHPSLVHIVKCTKRLRIILSKV